MSIGGSRCTVTNITPSNIICTINNIPLGSYTLSVTKGGAAVRNTLTVYVGAISNATSTSTTGGTSTINLYNTNNIINSNSIVTLNGTVVSAAYTVIHISYKYISYEYISHTYEGVGYLHNTE